MTSNSTNVSIRIDRDIKKKAEELFSDLGMNLSTGINIFLRKAVRVGGIPFEVTSNVLNIETLEAMEEARRISRDPSVKGYDDIDELLSDLKK